MGLSEAQLKQYDTDGFIIVHDLSPRGTIAS